MVWSIGGTKDDLVLTVSETGHPACHGSGRHDPRPPGVDSYGGNIDFELLKRIKQANCGWTIAVATESELHIDGNAEGLFARVNESPLKSHGMIKFYEHAPDVVTFMAVVPEVTFSHIRRLFELVLASEALSYFITIEFLGFRVPHAQTATPTWQEFVGGKPLFFGELSLSVSATKSDA